MKLPVQTIAVLRRVGQAHAAALGGDGLLPCACAAAAANCGAGSITCGTAGKCCDPGNFCINKQCCPITSAKKRILGPGHEFCIQYDDGQNNAGEFCARG
jgi:hypothetical protein